MFIYLRFIAKTKKSNWNGITIGGPKSSVQPGAWGQIDTGDIKDYYYMKYSDQLCIEKKI